MKGLVREQQCRPPWWERRRSSRGGVRVLGTIGECVEEDDDVWGLSFNLDQGVSRSSGEREREEGRYPPPFHLVGTKL